MRKLLKSKMSLFRFGQPFNTGATVKICNVEKSERFPFKNLSQKENTTSFSFPLNDGDIVLGLGEMLGSLNRRGKKYRCYATDDCLHTPEKESLYASHPFIVLLGKKSFGLFIDFPGEIVFDLGFSDHATAQVKISSLHCDIYFLQGNNLKDIIQQYLQLVGTPWAPPLWAFGYQQSRWSYPTADKIREVADCFAKHDLPIDAISMDIDYMDNFKVFTICEKNFPRLPDFIEEMKLRGIKLIPILDPGVKVEKNYPQYEDGIAKDIFCKDETGHPFKAAIWPGLSHFPDFLNPQAREWWAHNTAALVKLGIRGFWTDMNEPAIFFSEKSMQDALATLNSFQEKYSNGVPYSLWEYFNARGAISSATNQAEDFKSFYHETTQGKINHHEIHNLYGTAMVEATARGFQKVDSTLRHYILSRNSYVGLHRTAAIWTGDNASWWEHLEQNLQMLLSLNLCGFFFAGADVGGFNGNVSAELLIRWMQMGVVSPLFRNHTVLGSRNQEPWEFGDKTLKILRTILKLRYALIPYLYSEYMQARTSSIPFLRPLLFDYTDKISKTVEDQILVGGSLMMAPIIKANATGRFVHLPKHRWLQWSEKKTKIFAPGSHYIPAKLDEMLLFIKENSFIALTKPAKNLENYKPKSISVIGFVTGNATFYLYEDDGVSNSLAHSIITIKVRKKKITVRIDQNNHEFSSAIKKIDLRIYGLDGKFTRETVNMPTNID